MKTRNPASAAFSASNCTLIMGSLLCLPKHGSLTSTSHSLKVTPLISMLRAIATGQWTLLPSQHHKHPPADLWTQTMSQTAFKISPFEKFTMGQSNLSSSFILNLNWSFVSFHHDFAYALWCLILLWPFNLSAVIIRKLIHFLYFNLNRPPYLKKEGISHLSIQMHNDEKLHFKCNFLFTGFNILISNKNKIFSESIWVSRKRRNNLNKKVVSLLWHKNKLCRRWIDS